jgi:hypothetical protein
MVHFTQMSESADNQSIENTTLKAPVTLLRLQEENALLRESAIAFGALAERLAAKLRAHTPATSLERSLQLSEGLVGSF